MKTKILPMKTLLFLTILFTACFSSTNQRNMEFKTFPIIFETAFLNNTKVKQENIEYSFSTLDIGKIKIESGKLIVCDPIVMTDGIAFTQTFPKGQFPVQLAMAKTTNDCRVAFSRIFFSEKTVSRWEIALQPEQKQISIRDTTLYCFGVDSGTGIFIDESVNKIFKITDQSNWENVFVKKAEQSNYTGFLHEFDGHSLAAFMTGYGDGCYSTFIGFDENGNVCRLIVDFGLIDWMKLENK